MCQTTVLQTSAAWMMQRIRFGKWWRRSSGQRGASVTACREMEFFFMAREAQVKHCWQEPRRENLVLTSSTRAVLAKVAPEPKLVQMGGDFRPDLHPVAIIPQGDMSDFKETKS